MHSDKLRFELQNLLIMSINETIQEIVDHNTRRSQSIEQKEENESDRTIERARRPTGVERGCAISKPDRVKSDSLN